MSADDDRLFQSSSDPEADEHTVHVDRDAVLSGSAAPMSTVGAGHDEATASPMPVAPPGRTQTAQAPPPRQNEITSQVLPTPSAGHQRQPNAMMRASQANAPAGARYEQPRSLPTAPPRPAPGPAPSQHFADSQSEANGAWRPDQSMANPPSPTSAATIGNHRAIDALSHVGVRSAVKMPSQRGWRHVLYMLTRINLGLSPDELYEMDLHTRIRRNARDSYQIGVFGLKGGVGKTAVTVALGSSLSKVRGDRILAIDADPGGGNLGDRAGRQSAATVADLLADNDLARYNDIRAYTSMNAANLEVLSSEEYSGARREFNDEDWEGATGIVSRYYNLVLADCGAGRVVERVGFGDRFERVDRRGPPGRGDDGLVAAERISGSAGPIVRGDQPRRSGQAEHRRVRSGSAVRTACPARPGCGSAVGQAHRGGY